MPGVRRVYRRIPIVLAGLLIVLAGGASARPDPSDPADRPALAIYRPVPRIPVESQGTGLRPLVRASLSVDARGRVARVRVEAIEPSTHLDVHFRREAVAGLGRWRFRPERRGGLAVPVEVPVSIRFEPRTGGGRWEHLSLGFLRVDRDRETRRMQVLALPSEQRRRLRDGLLDEARELLDPAATVERASEGFLLLTDAPPGTAATLLGHLEMASRAATDLLGGLVPLQPAREQLVTVVFTSRARYREMARRADAFEWSAGLYHPAGFLAFHLEWAEPEPLLATLVHEATHAVMDQRVMRPGVLLPRWLDEGLATYLGFSEVEDGVLVPGRGGRWLERMRFVPVGPPSGEGQGEGGGGSEPRGRPFTLQDLMASGATTFYGERREQYYRDAWKAVHFLRHGEEGWAEERFPRLILYLAEGYDMAAAFRRVYGVAPEELEKAFRRHARRM